MEIGPVEAGVRTTFTGWGILEPTSAWECMAINLAQILDGTSITFKMNSEPKYGKDDKVAVASINQQLLRTLEKIESMPRATTDKAQEIADRY